MPESKYVVFTLGKERYGLPIERVERILPFQPATRIPRTPAMVLGVFDMRGETLAALDARQRFGMDRDDSGRNYVVTATGAQPIALRVDAVVGIVTFEDADIEDVHGLAGDDPAVVGIAKRDGVLTVLLSAEELVPANVRKKLAA